MDASGRLWPRAELRAGDADRQAVVAELQRHYVEGRLTSEELGERLATAMAARTFGELAVPLSDLPSIGNVGQIETRTRLADRQSEHPDFAPPLGAMLVLIGILAMLWMFVFAGMHPGGMSFWPMLIFGFFFLGRRGGRHFR